MNACKRSIGVALILTLSACGCTQSTTGVTGSTTDTRPPDQVVAEFLEAVRTGSDAKVANLLTPLARQKTAEMQMVVAPPGSDTAKFRVRGVELHEGDAQVLTDWTDLDTDGSQHTDEIGWMLRREHDGWRVWGMSSKIFDDLEPVVLNFENPQEMLRRQQLAEEEIARRERPQGPPLREIPPR